MNDDKINTIETDISSELQLRTLIEAMHLSPS